VRGASLLSVEVDEEVGRFVDADTVKFGDAEFLLETIPNRDGDVLGGRDLVREFGDLFVEVPMIHGIEDFAVENFLEVLEVHDESGLWVNGAFNRYFKCVVVAVSVRVVALAEDAAVLFGREVGIVIVVRGREFRLPS
jgi:hypothetical protein